MGIVHISVGLDHSECATTALTWAGHLADAVTADLRAVSAWQLPLVSMMPETVGALPTGEFMQEQTEALLAKVSAEVGLAERCELVAVEGPPGPVMADQTAPDTLVVLGRHGTGQHHGIARLVDVILGSAAHHAVHHAHGPVAVVPPDGAWVDAPTVVVGIDGSPSAAEALAWAVDSLPEDARIVAVRTIIPWAGDPLAPIDASFDPQVVGSAKAELRGWVDEIVAGCERSDREVTADVEIGAARWTLTNPDLGADILVVGHRGRTGITARLLGSVADHAVRHARVPVIVVRGTQS
jgi:nucleotide-binding universal stress UspA family protein